MPQFRLSGFLCDTFVRRDATTECLDRTPQFVHEHILAWATSLVLFKEIGVRGQFQE